MKTDAGTPRRPGRASALFVGVSVVLGACSTSHPTPDQPAAATVRPPTRSASVIAFDRRLEDMATLADRQGRLADEATTLELLALVRPDDRTVGVGRQALQERIATATQDRLRRGADALRRGQLDAAMSQYLIALALSPDNEVAANALRTIELERNRRVLLVKQRERTTTPVPATGD